jgi:hypothetical protein
MKKTRLNGFTQPPSKKLGACGLWYDTITKAVLDEKVTDTCIYFGSILEFTCYKVLINEFPAYAIDTHPRVELIPKTSRNEAIYWKVDFCLNWMRGGTGVPIYIEVKGKEMEGYRLRLALFKYRFPSVPLYIVKSVDDLKDAIARIKSGG